ncbi:bacterial bifunctional deaminase-reductase [Massarina eburnea CBS 473.64]|uniref:2,5-diamino-6-ribosylamino-4(3H)-pyrimidinone 5'-phosphate reductase n=1 Tax=Massarina eburnea CBS 473.64 TaxID=1395130 RepID=A0A6A6RIM6_9PLEO|nr:bacterial bifunctional deaminase-reductase [Massarina eburnea CBS 473.64]
MPPRTTLTISPQTTALLTPYLPPKKTTLHHPPRPFTTLTYATSLDATIALAPATQTLLSGPESKALTHYLRSQHTAILIGCGTAIADDPSLNCRIEGVGGYGGEGLEGQPRPVVLDPWGRWDVSSESQVVKLAREGRGKAPWVVCMGDVGEERQNVLKDVGGKFLPLGDMVEGRGGAGVWSWKNILELLWNEGVESVMVEGGGSVINALLEPESVGCVDSVIVTVAPVWLGKGGVAVVPEERRDGEGKKIAVGRLRDVRWVPLGEDVVVCGRP